MIHSPILRRIVGACFSPLKTASDAERYQFLRSRRRFLVYKDATKARALVDFSRWCSEEELDEQIDREIARNIP